MYREFFTFLLLAVIVDGAHKCLWGFGKVVCHRDPTKSSNVEIRAYDRDGISFTQLIDPDDLMAVTFSFEDGTFNLDGCGDDHDWIRGIPNYPEPYLQILHYCTSENGETIRRSLDRIFAPESYDLGVIDLDVPKDRMKILKSEVERNNDTINRTKL